MDDARAAAKTEPPATPPPATPPPASDPQGLEGALDARGFAVLPGLLDPGTCAALSALWPEEARFRSTIDMARHGFGQGRYRYFADPLPPEVGRLRRDLYRRLVPIANRWEARLGSERRFPPDHEDFRAVCAAAGQNRPTPLLLRYGPGDYNCLHQDLYGPLVFPLQVAVLLSRPGLAFTGGQFLLVEQRPRRQSRGEVVGLDQGDAVVFAVSQRPVAGGRGAYRVQLRHGVSTLLSGERFTLGIIFHDAA